MITSIVLIVIVTILLLVSGRVGGGQVEVSGGSFTMDRSYTDALRGLAMVFIMVQHAVGGVAAVLPGVAVFLILSGYGNNESYIAKGKWSIRHLLRIAIPYWIVRVGILIFTGGTHDWGALLLDLTFIRINSVYWFCAYLMKWYVAYWVGVNLLYRWRWYLWGLLALLSFFCYDPLNAEESFCFILGVALSEYKGAFRNLVNSHRGGYLSVLLIVISLVAVGAYLLEPVRANELMYKSAHTVARVFMAVGIIGMAWRVRLLVRSRVLLFMAPFTYELYLVHMKVVPLVDHTSNWLFVNTIVLFLVISFAGALLLNMLNKLTFKAILKK